MKPNSGKEWVQKDHESLDVLVFTLAKGFLQNQSFIKNTVTSHFFYKEPSLYKLMMHSCTL